MEAQSCKEGERATREVKKCVNLKACYLYKIIII
jgi:hypothetical protein